MTSMETTSFPRGSGGSSHSRKESGDTNRGEKSKKRDATDFLFGSRNDKQTVSSKRSSDRADTDGAKRRKKAQSTKTSRSLLPLGGGGVAHPLKGEGWIESLGFSKLHPGFALLGVVREVHEELAVFSLPNQWTGFMLRKDDLPCTAMFQVGEIMSVRIVKAVQESTKTGPRRRIQVTATPSKVNAPSQEPRKNNIIRGQILSVEDHGFLVDLGWQRRGFLRFDSIHCAYKISDDQANTKEDTDENHDDAMDVDDGRSKLVLGKGRILDVHVVSTDNEVVSLELLTANDRKTKLSVTSLPSIEELQPGTLVQCTVEKMVRNGLCVSFGGGAYRGAIDFHHLGGYWIPDHREESQDWKRVFEKHQAFKARIVAVDASTKIIRLSLHRHILDMTSPAELPSIGSVHEGIVVRMDEGIGALLALPELQPTLKNDGVVASSELYDDESYLQAARVQCVYVHISKAISSPDQGRAPQAIFGKEFAPSTKHSVRILNTSNLLEGIASGAAAPDIVNAEVLSYHDLQPGSLYRQVPICAHIQGGAVLVDFGMNVTGQIPAMHLFDKNATSDFRTRMHKVKYAVKAKIDVRVLSVKPALKNCVLTAKKSMVNETNILASYEDAKVGLRTTGFVSKMDERGMCVTFFNGVFGRVTNRSLRHELGLNSASEQYSVGDVVSCQVTQIKKKTRLNDSDLPDDSEGSRPYYEITLSLRDVKSEEDQDEVSLAHIRTGAVLPTKTLRVVQLVNGKSRRGALVPGYALVEVKSKYLIEGAVVGDTVECKLPYDQIFDEYDEAWLRSSQCLDQQAAKVLQVGEKIDRKSLVLTDPKKSSSEFKSGTGRLTLLSLRKSLIDIVEKGEDSKLIMPTPQTDLYVGARVVGFVCQIDPRFGGFVRFLDGLTGLVPKLKGGAELSLFATVRASVIAIDDSKSPPKILLGKASSLNKESNVEHVQVTKSDGSRANHYEVGDIITGAEIEKIDQHRAVVKAQDGVPFFDEIRVHCTMTPYRKQKKSELTIRADVDEGGFHCLHPFYNWKPGLQLPPLKVVSIERNSRRAIFNAMVTEPVSVNKKAKEFPEFVENTDCVKKGEKVSGVVGSVASQNSGLWIMLGPNTSAFMPSMDISDDVEVLSNLGEHFPQGLRLSCFVHDIEHGKKGEKDRILLTLMQPKLKEPPAVGAVVLGRINKNLHGIDMPALMVELRGGFTGRCCITEIRDREEWTNLPIGRNEKAKDQEERSAKKQKSMTNVEHGDILTFKVLGVSEKNRMVELSLRKSRLNGILEEDDAPEIGDVTQAYVIETNRKGCFMRISRNMNGRCVIKDLSDGFLSDPAASFPQGRLVVGKVRAVIERPGKGTDKGFFLDLNLRESAVADAKKSVELKDIKVGQKLHGTVSRIEEYGVFVHLEGSNIYGLVHKSECSDSFVKDVSKMYSPGDLVKVYVLKKDEAKRQVGLSMKASYFDENEDLVEDINGSENSSYVEGSDQHITEIKRMEVDEDADEDTDDDVVVDEEIIIRDTKGSDENDDNHSQSTEESVESIHRTDVAVPIMDMDVGFEWTSGVGKSGEADHEVNSSDESENEEEVSFEMGNHSRKNRGARRREEKQISEREKSLADGTADENPETTGDYERLVTSNPNSSELWIRYMAFHLSLADLDAARKVGGRALERIEFREEREKLNVWCALLTLEIKYGTEESIDDTIKRACSQSNPKHVHLRACEIMEKELEQGGQVTRQKVDQLLSITCKKFKSKKKVWISHIAYLLRTGKYDDALAVSKRALLSLPTYKHTEMMSRTAQLMFEHERVDQARTIFDALLMKNPKRLDIVSVYIDKEIKYGSIDHARQIFKDTASSRSAAARSMKLSEKQMKKLFKRWYTFEEKHGSKESCEAVKQAAIEYVEGK